jgi:hypothetical protein
MANATGNSMATQQVLLIHIDNRHAVNPNAHSIR